MNDDDFWNESLHNKFDFGDDEATIGNSSSSLLTLDLNKPKKSQKINLIRGNNKAGQVTSDYVTDIYNKYTMKNNFIPLLEKVQNDPISPDVTVIKILVGGDYYLEQHRSLTDKTRLLDCALKTFNGNVIITVVLFLKRTLKKSLFLEEMQKHPEAMQHYLHSLSINDQEELLEISKIPEFSEDAAILNYNFCLQESDPIQKITKLKLCKKSFLSSPNVPKLYSEIIEDHIKLLEWQLPVYYEDKKNYDSTLAVFQQRGKKLDFLDSSVITSLFYCCLYHYDLASSHIASPLFVKQHFMLTELQFFWAAFSALCQQNRWSDIDNLFINKNWMGKTQIRSTVGFNKIFSALAGIKAPEEVLKRYSFLIEDVHERLRLAKKYKLHYLIMKIIISKKDKSEIVQYISELTPATKEFNEANNALLNLPWKDQS